MVNFNPDNLLDDRPKPPPEGTLIKAARDAMRLPLREAGARAGISYATWRYAEAGYIQPTAGKYYPFRGSARVVSKMAAVVAVTAEQLTAADRADAASLLTERRAAVADPPAASALPEFDPVELNVWRGPGSKEVRMMLLSAYRAFREQRYEAWLSGQLSAGEAGAAWPA